LVDGVRRVGVVALLEHLQERLHADLQPIVLDKFGDVFAEEGGVALADDLVDELHPIERMQVLVDELFFLLAHLVGLQQRQPAWELLDFLEDLVLLGEHDGEDLHDDDLLLEVLVGGLQVQIQFIPERIRLGYDLGEVRGFAGFFNEERGEVVLVDLVLGLEALVGDLEVRVVPP